MIKILDSTLREGEQTPGVYFDTHIKIAITELLDDIGVNIIEAGHPAVTNQIYHSISEITKKCSHAIIGAHSRCLKKDVNLAIECKVKFLGIFYCVSDERLKLYSKNLNQVIEQIVEMIQYAKNKDPGLIIRYTPEDTVRSPWKNVIEVATEAVRAGADIISIADTTGYMIPGTDRSMYDYVKKLKDELADNDLYPEIAVHCHNDRGLALANALDGYRGGADIIDASVMGLGERAGIVDLATLLAVLATDFNERNRWSLKKIPELYNFVSYYSGIPIPVNLPTTCKHAFTHCAGIHTQATIKNSLHYQSLDPELFGRESEISLDHMSGLSSIKYSLEKIGEDGLKEDIISEVLSKVKDIGQKGRCVSLSELKYIVRSLKEDN